jgi:PTS system galactitol-specific IIA component
MKTYQLDDLVKEELIFLDIEAANKEDLIRKLCDTLFEKKYVNENYVNDVLKREENYPTGLPTEVLKVAIPHAEVSENIDIPVIVIARLKKPVEFIEMGTFEKKVKVNFVLLLAVKGNQTQLELLPKLISLFSQKEVMKKMKDSVSPKEIKDIISTHIS